jgi:hypothetical protein
MEDKNLLSTRQCAEALAVSQLRIRHMIRFGQLVARKLGRDWFVTAESLTALKLDRERRGIHGAH